MPHLVCSIIHGELKKPPQLIQMYSYARYLNQSFQSWTQSDLQIGCDHRFILCSKNKPYTGGKFWHILYQRPRHCSVFVCVCVCVGGSCYLSTSLWWPLPAPYHTILVGGHVTYLCHSVIMRAVLPVQLGLLEWTGVVVQWLAGDFFIHYVRQPECLENQLWPVDWWVRMSLPTQQQISCTWEAKKNGEGFFFILFLSCAASIYHNFAPHLHPVCSIYLCSFIAKVKVVKLCLNDYDIQNVQEIYDKF
jgi:hypothetical protein